MSALSTLFEQFLRDRYLKNVTPKTMTLGSDRVQIVLP
jgi:hypothetical protein